MSSSEPPDDPEPSDVADVFPEGISMGTSSGLAVLRVAFDGDDERAKFDEEEMSKKHAETADPSPTTTTLFHPTTGVPVTIIGTAHVSALAARQTRELILRLKPDVVVLELDPQRLVSMLRDAQLKLPARHLAETNVHTHWDALSVMYQGRLVQVMGGLAYAAVGAVLGSNPGAEFLAAVDAAKEVGAQIVVASISHLPQSASLIARTCTRRDVLPLPLPCLFTYTHYERLTLSFYRARKTRARDCVNRRNHSFVASKQFECGRVFEPPVRRGFRAEGTTTANARHVSGERQVRLHRRRRGSAGLFLHR
jgi:hypothetical protein